MITVRKSACGLVPVRRARPTVAATIPGMSTRLVPKRMTSRAVIPAESRPIINEMGRKAETGPDGAVAQHVLEIESAEEERGVQPRGQKAADDARVGEGPDTQDSQRHDRVLQSWPPWPRRRPRAATATPPSPSVWADAQP